MDNICNYGCGKKAAYTLKNGKKCCAISSNACLAVRDRNSKGVKNAYTTGTKGYTYNPASNWGKKQYKEPVDVWFTYNSKYTNSRLKKRLLDEQIKTWKCEQCGIVDWQGRFLQLHLDHIDGDDKNNNLDNLRLLCPNCHSQTETYCKGGRTSKERISDKEILEVIPKHTTLVDVLRELNLKENGSNYYRIKKLKEQLERLTGNS